MPDQSDVGGVERAEDTQYVDLDPLGFDYEWYYTKDHAKWAVSAEPNWICVGDINRQTSQEKRGGGTIRFEDQDLWEQLSKIDKMKA